jgi:hypothetical protein
MPLQEEEDGDGAVFGASGRGMNLPGINLRIMEGNPTPTYSSPMAGGPGNALACDGRSHSRSQSHPSSPFGWASSALTSWMGGGSPLGTPRASRAISPETRLIDGGVDVVSYVDGVNGAPLLRYLLLACTDQLLLFGMPVPHTAYRPFPGPCLMTVVTHTYYAINVWQCMFNYGG